MYKISLINNGVETIIHYPSPAAPKLFRADLDEKESQISQLTLDVPFPTQFINSPGYNLIIDRVTLVRVTRVSDNVIVWRGRAISSPEHMDNNSNPFFKESLCEDELGYMCDTQARPQTITNMLPYDFLTLLINNHNSHTTVDKQFKLGTVEMTTLVNTTLSFDTTLNTILTNLVNTQGGLIRLRYGTDDTRYLDYLSTNGNTNNTTIALGKNLDSMISDPDVTNIATRIIPVGKDNLTIVSINGGLDYVENADAVKQFGVVEQVVTFSDITDPTALMAAGEAELEQASKALFKLQVTALDLSTIGLDASTFYVSDNVRVTNQVSKFDDIFRVIEKTTDIIQPQNITLAFDNKFERLADKQVQMQRTANFVDRISDKGGVNAYYLQNSIDATKNMIIASGAYKNRKYIEGQGFLLENTDSTDASYGATYIAPTGILISNTKDTAGNWVWTTAATGAGFTADVIIAGILKSLNGITWINMEDGTFNFANKLTFDGTNLSIAGTNFVTYAADTGYKALELINRTLIFYSMLAGGAEIGGMQTVRLQDDSAEGIEMGIHNNSFFSFAKNDGGGTSVIFNNNVAGKTGWTFFDNMTIVKAGDGSPTQNGTVTISGVNLTFVNGLLTATS